MTAKSASLSRITKRHPNWDKMVSAAYLRMLGLTQREAAEAAGCSERTIRSWEARASLWAAARQEAGDRWLQEVTDASRRSVLKAAGRNAELGLKILERVDPELAPPKKKREHSGTVSEPLQVFLVGHE